MFVCIDCNKEFSSARSLGGHKTSAHREGPRYSVTRKTKPVVPCKNCGTPTTNTYCSNSCQMAWQREYIKRPEFLAGHQGMNPGTVRSF